MFGPSPLPGVSRTLLANSLQGEGIAYLHLRALGTPKPGREAARKGRVHEMRAIVARHMQEPDARLQFEQLREIAARTPTALLCFGRRRADVTAPFSPSDCTQKPASRL